MTLPVRTHCRGHRFADQCLDHATKYFARGWWQMIVSVVCSGSSWKPSLTVTPTRSPRAERRLSHCPRGTDRQGSPMSNGRPGTAGGTGREGSDRPRPCSPTPRGSAGATAQQVLRSSPPRVRAAQRNRGSDHLRTAHAPAQTLGPRLKRLECRVNQVHLTRPSGRSRRYTGRARPVDGGR